MELHKLLFCIAFFKDVKDVKGRYPPPWTLDVLDVLGNFPNDFRVFYNSFDLVSLVSLVSLVCLVCSAGSMPLARSVPYPVAQWVADAAPGRQRHHCRREASIVPCLSPARFVEPSAKSRHNVSYIQRRSLSPNAFIPMRKTLL